MKNSEVADISAFEGLQDNAHSEMGFDSLSVFNEFKITVPKLASKANPDLESHSYPSKEAAEKDSAAWRKAKMETKAGDKGVLVYTLTANGQRFTTTDKTAAENALNEAKQSKVIES